MLFKGSFWKWYLALAIVFSIVISFNFTKPFGFFRESNPALVAINAKVWEKDTETRKQNIPIASFAYNKDLPRSTQFDNTITTFGFAWFAVPYYFLQATNLPAGPIGLRIFSLLWLGLTVFAIYKLAQQLTKQLPHNKTIVFLTVCFYVLSPVVMWYQINGYVHETAVLPFYYSGWFFFLKFLEEQQSKWLRLAALSLFIAVQFDWLPFFQGAVMSCYLLFNRNRINRWTFILPALAIALGVGYIIYNYTSWSSVKDYFSFMQWKFMSRTVGKESHSYISFFPAKLNIFLFYALSYGMLLLFAVIALIKRKFHPFLWLMIITAVLHHIVFLGFSSEHDYAALKMAFPICLSAAMLIVSRKRSAALLFAALILLAGIGQYFFLHNYSYRKGMYKDEKFSIKAGNLIKALPLNEYVFLDTEDKYFPQVEFYAERAYQIASSTEDAKQKLLRMDSTAHAVFIELKNGQFVETKFYAK
jgi:hypothetical protein